MAILEWELRLGEVIEKGDPQGSLGKWHFLLLSVGSDNLHIFSLGEKKSSCTRVISSLLYYVLLQSNTKNVLNKSGPLHSLKI